MGRKPEEVKSMTSNPVFSIALFMFLYAVGKMIAKKTSGIIVEALFLSVVYAAGFIFGIIPSNSLELTGIPAMMSAFGTMLLVTNLGTMIELARFIREWKTVVVCFGGLLVMSVLFCTVGIMFYGREYSLTAIAPVAGGIVATGIISAAAEEAGQLDFAAFASLICSLQTFVGVPASAYLMHKYCDSVVKSGDYSDHLTKESHFSIKFIKMPAALNEGSMMVFRLLLVTLLGQVISTASGGTLPAAVVVLVLGIIGTEIGFLEPQTLTRAGYMSFLLMGLILTLPHGFRTLTAESFGAMIVPLVFFLILGAIGLIIGGAIIGKILKVDMRLAASVSLSAMFGFPLTQIIVDNVVDSYDLDDETREKLREKVMPQMIIAGFTTVTVTSVALAGFVAPLIFK